MIDHQKLDRSFTRFELEAELFLERGKYRRRIRRKCDSIARWKCLMFVRL
jgi:hypothetical protein